MFDAVPLCGVAAINATYRTILDADEVLYEATRTQRRLVVENATSLAELLFHRVLRPWCHPEWLFRLTDRRHGEFQDMVAMYDRLILDVLDSKLVRVDVSPLVAQPPGCHPGPHSPSSRCRLARRSRGGGRAGGRSSTSSWPRRRAGR